VTNERGGIMGFRDPGSNNTGNVTDAGAVPNTYGLDDNRGACTGS
jgi:hypothetical protein